MRTQAIEIAWHEGSSIWSVNCALSGRRFVTGGNDSVARIWALEDDVYDALAPALTRKQGDPRHSDRSAASPTAERRQPVHWICDLSGHTATVNTAQFSRTGDAIATAADKGELIVWRREVERQAACHWDIRRADAATERWSLSCLMRGHTADVLDVCWSIDGTKLASASVDNSIRVWDLANPKRPLAVISNHASMVQGVAFDPTGRFLASLGNDRAFAVHMTSGYKLSGSCTMTSTEPRSHYFASDTSSHSMYRRLAWSPDGSFLACPSGLQTPVMPKPHVYAVHLFARGQWTKPVLQCAGLQKLPVAVAFCPRLFTLRNFAENAPHSPYFALPYRMVFAVACFDAVLVYDTESFGRPFARVAGVHYSELTDISWGADGSALLVSSTDGSVSVIALSEEEVGTPLPKTQWPQWMLTESGPSTGSSPVAPGPEATCSTVLEPVSPLMVAQRSKHAVQPPCAAVHRVTDTEVREEHGMREVTVVVPRRRLPDDAVESKDCVPADDPARKRLKLD
jgi:chromatin assembly factor 1 subunit B